MSDILYERPLAGGPSVRIRRTSPNERMVVWYEPRLGLEVKRDWVRFATHPFGPGTHRMEMLSYAIKN